MTGRTIVVTGASDGVGAAAARRLAQRGEKVVVVGRSATKTGVLAKELRADYFVADFADLSQVRSLAEDLRSRYPRIDVLANNAGGMTTKLQISADGYEQTYQVNYLAPFLLTTALLEVLVDSRAAVVNTTSASQKLVRKFTIEDLESTHHRRPSQAYALTKLAIILFTRELHRRYHDAGLSAAAFHPGFVDSNFGSASGSRFLVFMRRTPVRLLTASADQAAEQLVWLATSMPDADWKSGEYYSRHKVAKANRRAYDAELARELWDRSLTLVNPLAEA